MTSKNELDPSLIKSKFKNLTQKKHRIATSSFFWNSRKIKLRKNETPPKNCSGVYAFWWNGNVNEFKKIISNDFLFNRKKGHIKVTFSNKWVKHFSENKCLYIGKADILYKRLQQHFRITTNKKGNITSGLLASKFIASLKKNNQISDVEKNYMKNYPFLLLS